MGQNGGHEIMMHPCIQSRGKRICFEVSKKIIIMQYYISYLSPYNRLPQNLTTLNIHYITVSVDQEFVSGLAG